jgi:hypothetical protein
MSIAFVAACKRLAKPLGAAIFLIFIGAFAGAQSPSSTSDPLSLLKNLTPEQQDALMQSVLGKGDGTNKKTDSQLNSPETVQKKNDRTGGLDTQTDRNKTLDGRTLRRLDENPELRAGDFVLIDLTPVEFSQKEGNLIGQVGAGTNAPGQAGAIAGLPAGATNPNSNANANANAASALSGINDATKKTTDLSDFGRLQIDQKPKTDEQTTRSAMIRDRILKGNPYQLNQFGVLEIPGLPAIPLAGLTAEEATRRLSRS